jgi:hypothetical protein
MQRAERAMDSMAEVDRRMINDGHVHPKSGGWYFCFDARESSPGRLWRRETRPSCFLMRSWPDCIPGQAS